MKLLALLGRKLGHTFSPTYFQNKFEKESITGFHYSTIELAEIQELPEALKQRSELMGLNVTIPYKQEVIPYLDELDETSSAIGAVNTISINGKHLKGYNTDVIGFEETLTQWMPDFMHAKALILGTGGASKAVKYVLEKYNIPHLLVSSSGQEGAIGYKDITSNILQDHSLIINTTPLGMYPKVDQAPDLDYECLGEGHYLYDLVYNPAETLFMKNGLHQGSHVKNGYDMLVAQAEASWKIWNGKL